LIFAAKGDSEQFAEAGIAIETSLDPAPNHLSFLSTGTNDAMLGVLAPLIPIARILGVRMLDFDVYTKNRDSAATAALFVPAVVAFFVANVRRR